MTFLTILGFVKDHWKTVLVGVLIAILWGLQLDVKMKEKDIVQLTEKVTTLTTQVTQMTTSLADANGQLNIVHQANIDQQKAAQAADVQRLQIISTMTTAISSIRAQPIPKDCPSAIDYGISHRGDITWPKQ